MSAKLIVAILMFIWGAIQLFAPSLSVTGNIWIVGAILLAFMPND